MKLTKIVKYGLAGLAIYHVAQALFGTPKAEVATPRRRGPKASGKKRATTAVKRQFKGKDSVAHDSSGHLAHHKVGRGVVHS